MNGYVIFAIVIIIFAIYGFISLIKTIKMKHQIKKMSSDNPILQAMMKSSAEDAQRNRGDDVK